MCGLGMLYGVYQYTRAYVGKRHVGPVKCRFDVGLYAFRLCTWHITPQPHSERRCFQIVTQHRLSYIAIYRKVMCSFALDFCGLTLLRAFIDRPTALESLMVEGLPRLCTNRYRCVCLEAKPSGGGLTVEKSRGRMPRIRRPDLIVPLLLL